jgi:predicted 3-demethylubiquinone-9 3-methyltransferase (glyoxalase superfamily)
MVVPTIPNELILDKDQVKGQHVMKAMMEMDKIDTAALKRAHDQAVPDR